MKHSKTICTNTLSVTNAYLLSYIPNNVNALIMLIVHYFLNYIPQFFHIGIPRSAPMGGSAPQTPLSLDYMSLFLNLEDVWLCFVCLERATLPDAVGNIASAMELYCKVALKRYTKHNNSLNTLLQRKVYSCKLS